MSPGVKNEKTAADFVVRIYRTSKDFLNTEMSCIKYSEVLRLHRILRRSLLQKHENMSSKVLTSLRVNL